jgi:MoxR-like ATPase
MVGPITRKDNFEALINGTPTTAYINLPNKLLVTPNEWKSWGEKINTVSLSKETLLIVHSIRKALSDQFEELGVYVSDRRWQKAGQLLKASAFFNDRTETNHSDALLLSNCIWTSDENREAVIDIVHDSIKDVGFTSDISLADLDKEKGTLDKEIHKELFYKSDVYKTIKIGNKKYFKAVVNFEYGNRHRQNIAQRTLYIPVAEMKSKNSFKPTDARGNVLDDYECNFDGQGTCLIKAENFEYHYDSETNFMPDVLFHKGDKKEDINTRLIESLKSSIIEVREKLMATLEVCQVKYNRFEATLSSPFVSDELLKIPLKGIVKQLKNIDVRIKDCQRLEALCCE